MQEDPVIASLERDLARLRASYQEQERAFLETIATRKQALLAGKPELVAHRKIQPGEYAGLELSAAMQLYLAARGGGPVRRERMAADLALAGVKLGMSNRHERNLKITASNNRGIFSYDETSDAIGLVSAESTHAPPTRRARGAG